MRVVRIRVTGNIAGVAMTMPYQHDYAPPERPLYRVPTYEVRVNEINVFHAIRFGFRGHFEHPWDPHRRCNDDGIIAQPEVAAQWNGAYTPHSFHDQQGSLFGGFRIRRDQVYIHEGPVKGQPSGTLGCVEITSDGSANDWNRFVLTVARQAGVPYVGAAVQAGKVLVTVEAAAVPNGLLIGRTVPKTDPTTGQVFTDFDGLADWDTTTVPWSGR